MSARVKRNIHVLKTLAHCHPSVTKRIVQGADKDLTDCLSECAHNVLAGNVPLKPAEKARLTKYKQKLRKVSSRKTSLKSRRTILQTGGFLGALIKPLLSGVLFPVITNLAGSIIKKVHKKKKQ